MNKPPVWLQAAVAVVGLAAAAFVVHSLTGPGSRQPAAPVSPPRPRPSATYVVRPGDTLSGIAAGEQVPVRALEAANRLGPTSVLQPDEVLKVPHRGGATRGGRREPLGGAAPTLVALAWVLAGMAGLALLGRWLAVRVAEGRNRRLAAGLRYYKVRPPADFRAGGLSGPKAFLVSLSRAILPRWQVLLRGQPFVRFLAVVAGSSGTVTLYLGLPEFQEGPLKNAFRAAYPGVELVPADPPQPPNDPKLLTGLEMRPYRTRSRNGAPLILAMPDKLDHDLPLEHILAGLGSGRELPDGTAAFLDLVLRPVPEWSHLQGAAQRHLNRALNPRRRQQELGAGPGFWSLVAQDLVHAATKPATVPPPSQQYAGAGRGAVRARVSWQDLPDWEKDFLAQLRRKAAASERAFRTDVRIGAWGAGAAHLVSGGLAGFSRMDGQDALQGARLAPERFLELVRAGMPRAGNGTGYVLSSAELAGLARIPDSTSPLFAYLDRPPAKTVRPPADLLGS
jgi:LysM repeat protein